MRSQFTATGKICRKCRQDRRLEEFATYDHGRGIRQRASCKTCDQASKAAYKSNGNKPVTKIAPHEKPCTKCLVVRPIDAFAWNSAGKNSGSWPKKYRASVCKACMRDGLKAWVARVGKRRARMTGLKRKYGITHLDYEAMLAAQDSLCLICLKPETAIDVRTGDVFGLAIDHCHTSGKVRGLLCVGCNNGLGCFRDDPERLASAILYLNKHSQTPVHNDSHEG